MGFALSGCGGCAAGRLGMCKTLVGCIANSKNLPRRIANPTWLGFLLTSFAVISSM